MVPLYSPVARFATPRVLAMPLTPAKRPAPPVIRTLTTSDAETFSEDSSTSTGLPRDHPKIGFRHPQGATVDRGI